MALLAGFRLRVVLCRLLPKFWLDIIQGESEAAGPVELHQFCSYAPGQRQVIYLLKRVS